MMPKKPRVPNLVDKGKGKVTDPEMTAAAIHDEQIGVPAGAPKKKKEKVGGRGELSGAQAP